MKTLHKRCAGVDVHKTEVVVCLRLVTHGKVEREVRRFPATTHGLLELAEWLESARMYACSDGSDRRLLEAGLAHSRRAFCTDPGECSACEDGAWTKE